MKASLPAHGGQRHTIAALAGMSMDSLLDFSANINPDGPPPSVVPAIRGALDEAGVLEDYPDLAERSLREAIAAYARVPVETVTVANGFVPLLETSLRVWPIRRCLLPIPAFAEYKRALDLAKVEIVPFALEERRFVYHADELVSAIRHAECDAVLLANPQNPSGVLASRDTMLCLVERLHGLGVRVLLDEAFIDYAPGESLSSDVEAFSNLTVFRSVTKFHALPGLRVAYALASRDNTASLSTALAPWAITTLASRGVIAALDDAKYVGQTLQRNETRRELLRASLLEIGIATYPSTANFFLLRLPRSVDTDELWSRMIREFGIVLRNCANFEGLSQGHLRCAIRNEEDNARLVSALTSLL
jgi:threonine-phosphate decarboxylase